MKILKLQFHNINSLKGTHTIDFTENPFRTGSLFAITGPTGSGKSTILDVISLALFNQIPRLGGISKSSLTKTGAIITKNQREASAEVSYECKEGRFTSKWYIAYNRNNNLNDYGMELSGYDTGEILDFKKSEVPAENEKLIGLNYSQFIKSVVLAQGEFAQFLKAKKDERAELLEKITGTGIYRTLGIAAFEKFKSVNNVIKAKQDQIIAIANHLLEEEVFKDKKSELSKKEAEIKEVELLIKQYESQVLLKQNIISHTQEIEQLTVRTAARRTDIDDFKNQYGKAIEQHEKLQPFAESIRAWENKQARLKETAVELENVKEKAIRNSTEEEILISKAKELCNQEVESATLVESVELFAGKVSELQDERLEKGREYKSIQNQFERELKEIAFEFNPKDAEASLASLQRLESTKKVELNSLEAEMRGVDIEDLPTARKKLQERMNTMIHAKQQANQLNEVKNTIEKAAQKENALQEEKTILAPQLSTAIKEIELLSEKLQHLETKKENKQLKADLNDLRLQLVPDTACPLCGSKEHPYAGEEEKEVDELSMLIKEQKEALDKQKENRTKNANRLELLEEQLLAIVEEKRFLKARLLELKKEFEKTMTMLTIDASTVNWEVLTAEMQKQMANIDNIQELRTKTESIAAAIPLHSELNQIIVDGKKLETKLKELYSGDDIKTESSLLIKDWLSNQQNKKYIQEQKQELDSREWQLQSEMNQLHTDLDESLKTIGFTAIADAQSALLGASQYKDLRDKREYLQKQLDAGLQQLQVIEQQLIKLKKDDSKQELEEIQALLATNNENKIDIQNTLDELRSQIKTQETYLLQLDGLKKSIAEEEKKNLKWRLLNELIGDATGKKFNDFAQDLSLSQLLILANKRLQDLSDRYILDKPDLDTEDDSLVAIDEHMGGQRRSVKTLSGGETFILSLSMALALSDMTSRNVTINSLFIDEGFGTLDPETLDQTLDTLEKLQAESSKTVGIISHVDSLKERIGTQIRLSRNGQGYSRIEIVG